MTVDLRDVWREKPTILMSAASEEAAGLRALLVEESIEDGPGGLELRRGRILDFPVAMLACGEGGQRAATAMQWLDEVLPSAPILFLGVAGGLSETLEPGDLVVGECALEVGEEPVEAPLDLCCEETAAALAFGDDGLDGPPRPAGPAVLVTVDWIVSDSLEKTRLWETAKNVSMGTARSSRRVLGSVDMESATVGRLAQRAGRRLLVIRAISDTSTESLLPFLERCRRPDGSINRWRVTGYALLSGPHTILNLLHLRGRLRLCSDRLTEFALGWLDLTWFDLIASSADPNLDPPDC